MAAPAGSRWQQGACFRFVVPPGWTVGEEGAFAVVLRAADACAVTTMVGNAGVPLHVDPGAYAWDKLTQSGLQNLRFGGPRPAPGVFGFPYAWAFEADYVVSGVACRGVARCSVAPAYDSATMVLTWAASVVPQWAHYQPWLPDLAAAVEVTHPAAFGAAGVAAQNLQNSVAFGEQARRAREHGAAAWAEVADARDRSAQGRHDGFGDAMSGTERYDNPYDRRALDLPASNAVYWVHPVTGQILGSPDASFDPRSPQDAGWVSMPRSRR